MTMRRMPVPRAPEFSRIQPARPPQATYVNPEPYRHRPVQRRAFDDSWPTYVFLASFAGLMIMAFLAGFFFHAILERL